MKTIITSWLLAILFVSCTKESPVEVNRKPQTIIIKVETVKGDGTVEYSPSVSVKM